MQFVGKAGEDISIIRHAGSGAIYKNARGDSLMRTSMSVLMACFEEAQRTSQMLDRTVDGRRLFFVPLLAELEGVDAVLATDAALSRIPQILHDLHSPTRHFARILHSLPQIVLTARPNGTIDYVSKRWYDVAPSSRAEPDAHANVMKAFASSDKQRAIAAWDEGIGAGIEFNFEVRLRTTEGEKWFVLQAMPWRAHERIIKWAVTLTDVDAQVRARAALERSRLRLRLLADIGAELGKTNDVAAMATRVAGIVAAWSGCATLVELHDDTERFVLAVRPTAARFGKRSESIAAEILRAGDDGNPETADVCIARVRGRDGLRGFVALQRSPAFDREQDALVLAEIADRVGTVAENIIRFRRERRVAEVLQRALLPIALPQITGVSFDVAYSPATADILVGGDWYDAFLMRDGRVAFTIGDVAGHGLEAAVVMSDLRRAMRSAALDKGDPGDILTRANAVAIVERHPMATAFFGILDPLTLRLSYASAGHPPPILAGSTGDLQELSIDGPPLGVVEGASFQTHHADLTDDSAIVLYTDGVLEAGREALQAERTLAEAIKTWSLRRFSESADDLQRRVLGTATLSDDAAMFVMRVTPPDEFSVAFSATSYDSHRARIALQRTLKRTTLGQERAYDFALAVSEAMNNAAEHAYVDGSGTVRVKLRTEANRLIAEVHDAGLWKSTSSPNRGRGIHLMKALADTFSVERDETGTTVRLEIGLPAPSPAAAFG